MNHTYTDQIITLRAKPYIQNKYIITTLTQQSGMQAFMLYPALRKKNGNVLLTPLNLAEITCHTNGKHLPVIQEIDLLLIPKNTQNDIRRQCITLFIAEILNCIFTHPMQDIPVFNFIVSLIHQIENEQNCADIPIAFLVELSDLLGFSYRADEGTRLTNTATGTERQQMLLQLCRYYQDKLEYFRLPKSLPILQEIFH